MSISKVVLSTFVAAGLMVVGMNGAMANHMPEHEASPEQMAMHMQKKLNLSDDQRDKVQDIISDSQKKADDLRDQMHQLHEETRDKFKDVLTPEQYKKWETMREEKHEKMMSKKEMHKKHMQEKAAQ